MMHLRVSVRGTFRLWRMLAKAQKLLLTITPYIESRGVIVFETELEISNDVRKATEWRSRSWFFHIVVVFWVLPYDETSHLLNRSIPRWTILVPRVRFKILIVHFETSLRVGGKVAQALFLNGAVSCAFGRRVKAIPKTWALNLFTIGPYSLCSWIVSATAIARALIRWQQQYRSRRRYDCRNVSTWHGLAAPDGHIDRPESALGERCVDSRACQLLKGLPDATSAA